MTQNNEKNLTNLTNVADNLQASADKVEDGINNVLEPEIKDTRISSNDTQRLMQDLNRKVIILFSVSVAINALTLLYVLNGQ